MSEPCIFRLCLLKWFACIGAVSWVFFVSVPCVISSQSLASTSEQTGNPVGSLQELTQKKYMAPPTYEFQDDGCPPHKREYTCTVKLLSYSNTGKAVYALFYFATAVYRDMTVGVFFLFIQSSRDSQSAHVSVLIFFGWGEGGLLEQYHRSLRLVASVLAFHFFVLCKIHISHNAISMFLEQCWLVDFLLLKVEDRNS